MSLLAGNGDPQKRLVKMSVFGSGTLCNDDLQLNDYISKPVKIRALLALPSVPSLRLKSILAEAIPGAKLRHRGVIESDKGTASGITRLKMLNHCPITMRGSCL